MFLTKKVKIYKIEKYFIFSIIAFLMFFSSRVAFAAMGDACSFGNGAVDCGDQVWSVCADKYSYNIMGWGCGFSSELDADAGIGQCVPTDLNFYACPESDCSPAYCENNKVIFKRSINICDPALANLTLNLCSPNMSDVQVCENTTDCNGQSPVSPSPGTPSTMKCDGDEVMQLNDVGKCDDNSIHGGIGANGWQIAPGQCDLEQKWLGIQNCANSSDTVYCDGQNVVTMTQKTTCQATDANNAGCVASDPTYSSHYCGPASHVEASFCTDGFESLFVMDYPGTCGIVTFNPACLASTESITIVGTCGSCNTGDVSGASCSGGQVQICDASGNWGSCQDNPTPPPPPETCPDTCSEGTCPHYACGLNPKTHTMSCIDNSSCGISDCKACTLCPAGTANPYTTCQNGKCVANSGCGINQCTSDADCPCPAGEEKPHNVCPESGSCGGGTGIPCVCTTSNTCGVPCSDCGVGSDSACGTVPSCPCGENQVKISENPDVYECTPTIGCVEARNGNGGAVCSLIVGGTGFPGPTACPVVGECCEPGQTRPYSTCVNGSCQVMTGKGCGFTSCSSNADCYSPNSDIAYRCSTDNKCILSADASLVLCNTNTLDTPCVHLTQDNNCPSGHVCINTPPLTCLDNTCPNSTACKKPIYPTWTSGQMLDVTPDNVSTWFNNPVATNWVSASSCCVYKVPPITAGSPWVALPAAAQKSTPLSDANFETERCDHKTCNSDGSCKVGGLPLCEYIPQDKQGENCNGSVDLGFDNNTLPSPVCKNAGNCPTMCNPDGQCYFEGGNISTYGGINVTFGSDCSSVSDCIKKCDFTCKIGKVDDYDKTSGFDYCNSTSDCPTTCNYDGQCIYGGVSSKIYGTPSVGGGVLIAFKQKKSCNSSNDCPTTCAYNGQCVVGGDSTVPCDANNPGTTCQHLACSDTTKKCYLAPGVGSNDTNCSVVGQTCQATCNSNGTCMLGGSSTTDCYSSYDCPTTCSWNGSCMFGGKDYYGTPGVSCTPGSNQCNTTDLMPRCDITNTTCTVSSNKSLKPCTDDPAHRCEHLACKTGLSGGTCGWVKGPDSPVNGCHAYGDTCYSTCNLDGTCVYGGETSTSCTNASNCPTTCNYDGQCILGGTSDGTTLGDSCSSSNNTCPKTTYGLRCVYGQCSLSSDIYAPSCVNGKCTHLICSTGTDKKCITDYSPGTDDAGCSGKSSGDGCANYCNLNGTCVLDGGNDGATLNSCTSKSDCPTTCNYDGQCIFGGGANGAIGDSCNPDSNNCPVNSSGTRCNTSNQCVPSDDPTYDPSSPACDISKSNSCYHFECSSNSCALATGPGVDATGCTAENVGTPNSCGGSASRCTSTNGTWACNVSSNPIYSLCNTNNPTGNTCDHMVCSSSHQCEWVNGPGTNCSGCVNQDGSTKDPGTYCNTTSKCILSSSNTWVCGDGTDANQLCDTSNPNHSCDHMVCSSSHQCEWVNGPGNTCAGCINGDGSNKNPGDYCNVTSKCVSLYGVLSCQDSNGIFPSCNADNPDHPCDHLACVNSTCQWTGTPGDNAGGCTAENWACGNQNPTASNLQWGSENNCVAQGKSAVFFKWDISGIDGLTNPQYIFEMSTSKNFGDSDLACKNIISASTGQITRQVYVQLPNDLNPGTSDQNNCYINFGVPYYWRVQVANSDWYYFNENNQWNTGSTNSIDATSYTKAGHPAPFVSFSFSPTKVAIGALVSFTNSSTCFGNNCTYSWDFGDNSSPVTSASPSSRSYSSSGTKTVNLTVCDDQYPAECCTSPATLTVKKPANGGAPNWKEISPFQ